MRLVLRSIVVAFFALSCSERNVPNAESSEMNTFSKTKPTAPLIIAHRGTTYWAPEETEAAMRWARNTGVHYLEFDLQRTKDGYLIALHDENLLRTSDIALKFPDRKHLPVSSFTYEELLSLDIGSWFNLANPDRARKGFVGQDLLTLEDMIMIAEGNRIVRDVSGRKIIKTNKEGKFTSQYEKDPIDNGHRPGIYPETKVPKLFPGIEEDLMRELSRLGWYGNYKRIQTKQGKIAIANTSSRVILQTFSKESLARLQETFVQRIPTCFLLWRGDDVDDMPDSTLESYAKWVQYGKQHGATIIGPSIAGPPNNYPNLLTPETATLIRSIGLDIHAYSFDTRSQLDGNKGLVDGAFTNKADEALNYFYPSAQPQSASVLLEQLGYAQ